MLCFFETPIEIRHFALLPTIWHCSYNTVIDLYNKHQHTLKKMNTYHNLAEEIAQAKEFFSLQTNVIEKFQVKETTQG